ncbi:Peroxisomal primary amine oxidase, partial [Dissostichus eleginoides]
MAYFPVFLCLVVAWSFSGYAIGNPDSLRPRLVTTDAPPAAAKTEALIHSNAAWRTYQVANS